MTLDGMASAFSHWGGVDCAESILLLVDEQFRDGRVETVDLACVLGYIGQPVGLVIISRSERPEDCVIARAAG